MSNIIDGGTVEILECPEWVSVGPKVEDGPSGCVWVRVDLMHSTVKRGGALSLTLRRGPSLWVAPGNWRNRVA